MTERANRTPEQIADEVRAALEAIHENVVVCVEPHSEYWKDHLIIRTWIDREELPKYEFVDSMMEMDWVNVSDKKIVPFFTLVSAIIDPNSPDWMYETARRGVVPTVEGVAEWCEATKTSFTIQVDSSWLIGPRARIGTSGINCHRTITEAACRAYLAAVEGVEG